MTNISFTIPREVSDLRATAAMLIAIADSLPIAGTIENTISSDDLDVIEKAVAPVAVSTGHRIESDNTVDLSNPVITSVIPDPETINTGTQKIDYTPKAKATPTKQPSGTVDATGMIWDKRIHGGGKTFLESGKRKGCWKYIRGLDKRDPELINRVEAELLNGAAAAQPATAQQPAGEGFELDASGQAVPVSQLPDANAAFGNKPDYPVTATTLAQENVQQPTACTFPELLQKTAQRQIAKPEYQKIVNATLAKYNIAALPQLGGLPDMVGIINTELDAQWQG